MAEGLTLEKMKIVEKLTQVEDSVTKLDKSVQEIQTILFGDKGEKGVVSKLNEMTRLAESIQKTIDWIAKLILTALILGGLPYATEFINKIIHHG